MHTKKNMWTTNTTNVSLLIACKPLEVYPHGTRTFLCTRRFNESLFHLKACLTPSCEHYNHSHPHQVWCYCQQVSLKTHCLKNMPRMFPGMESMKGIILNSWNGASTLKRGFFAFPLMRHGKRKREWVTKPHSDIQTMPYYYFQGTFYCITTKKCIYNYLVTYTMHLPYHPILILNRFDI